MFAANAADTAEAVDAADAGAVAPAPAPVAATRRYPGVRSFEERDRAQFRGRQAASDELLLRVLSVRLLLQFAPSGVGKSSLLAAGLFPRLRPYDYFPFIVRLNLAGESLVDAVRRSLAQAAAEHGLLDPVIPARPPAPQADTLWALLAGTQLWSDELLLLSPVLVFDQFEEVFTLRDAAFRADFAQQLGALAHSTPRPEATPSAKFILSLREEYLGKLEEFSASIPDLFRERLRLPPLSEQEAREAIVAPAALPGTGWASPPFGYTEEALALLIDFIDGVSESVKLIEPLTLQLVCNRAESIAIERSASAQPLLLDVHDFGGMAGLERLVREHYRHILDRIAPPAARRRAQWMLEEGLLDPSGKRLMLEQGEIERRYRVDAASLDALVASSLLRREPRHESVFYEISHDRLTDSIAKQRRPRLPGWVRPTLGVGALVLALVVFSWWRQRDLTEQARGARNQAEYAVGQLLSEKLVAQLRDAGLSEALRQILEQADHGSDDDYAIGLARVLKWRHKADIERDRGTLAKARTFYRGALDEMDRLPAAAGAAGALLHAERARIVTALGGLAVDAGEIALADQQFAEAQRLWAGVLEATPSPRPQELLDAADSHVSYANLRQRAGDGDGAEAQALIASRLATRVWSAAYDGRHGQAFDANFEIGRALQVFSDSALSLSIPRGEVEVAETALRLARESVRLRPLSFQARRQLGTAIVNRFNLQLPATPEEWRMLWVEARHQFDDLGQADADNLRMRRERAALELAVSETVALCWGSPACRKVVPAEAPKFARISALESTGTFRRLAASDAANRSLLSDVAWGLRVQSRWLAIDGDPAALEVLDRGTARRTSARVEAGDFEARQEIALNTLQRASLLARAHRPDEVRASIDRALEEIGGLPGDVLGARLDRPGLTDSAIATLREAGLAKEAAALQVGRDALPMPASGPRAASYDRALALNHQAVTLAKGAGGQADERKRIAALHLQAVDDYPFDPILWSNLRVARTNLDDDGLPAGDIEAGAAREIAARGALAAAWMADVLHPDTDRLRQLYEARRRLAIKLNNRGGGPELLALTERGLAEANELMRTQPDAPEALFDLADASLGVGVMRETQHADGWDEAFRVALLYGEQLARVEPKRADRRLWLGVNRLYLAQLLDRDQRHPAAMEQRQHALAPCRAALTLGDATERDQAQDCLKQLADAGIK